MAKALASTTSDPFTYAEAMDSPQHEHWKRVVLATVPYLEPAGFIGLRGNGLTTSKINDFLSELPN